MRKQIEALIFGRRWRADEQAWRLWQAFAPLVPAGFEVLNSGRPVAGRIERVYQRAQRGTKAVVNFGEAVGLQDTWWDQMRPASGQWVIVRTHLWFPPGTHSGQHVVWIDSWESQAAGDVYTRALRHERRVARERIPPPPPPPPPPSVPPGPPVHLDHSWTADEGIGDEVPPEQLFASTGFATPVGLDEVMSAAAEVALELQAGSYGPALMEGGQLLMLWPPDPTPSFVSITGRPIAGHGSRIGISVQSLAAGTLDVMAEVSAAMESRLGTLDRGVVPPPREVEYDRAATRRLEREIQELLEGMAADPGSRSELSKAIFEREIPFRHLTQLGG